MTSLPLSSLTLRLATREEAIQARKGAFSQWGRGLTLEKYLARDALMDTLEFATDGKMNTWVLVPRDISSHPFVASCETYRRDSLVMRPGDDAPLGAISYGIASVFTPPAFRRNGYAAHMMRLLHRVLAPASSLPPFPVEIWGQPPPPIPPGVKAGDALFSVLYSDVGPQFYKLCGPVPGADGWIVSDPWSTIWDLDDSIDQHPGSSSLKWLEANDIFPHLQGDAWELATHVLPANAAASGGKIHVAVRPSREQITFLTARYLLTLPTPPLAPTRWGAAITSDNVRQSSYVVWAPEPHPHSTLFIIRMRCDSVRTFSVLLGAAKQAARDFGLKHVEIWNTIPKSGWMADLARKWGGRRVRRSEHLPAIAWYGGDKSDDILWDLNERFVWC